MGTSFRTESTSWGGEASEKKRKMEQQEKISGSGGSERLGGSQGESYLC